MKRNLWKAALAALLALSLLGAMGCGGDGNTTDDTTVATDAVTTETPETEPQGPEFVSVDTLTEGVVKKENGFVYLSANSDLISLGGIAAPADNNGEYYRFNAANKSAYPEDIQREGGTMAGGTLRFLLKGDTIRIKATRRTDLDFVNKFGNYAFDIYVGSGTERAHWMTVTSPFDQDFESEDIVLPENAEQEIMICLPYNMGFTDLQVVVKEGSSVAAAPARLGGAIGFYGSSITQGYDGGAPSLSYAMRLCRELDADCVNFGLSGAARGEKAVIDDICAKIKDAGLTAFILDYDWNINSSVELENGSDYWNGYGYYTIYEKLRAALGPDVPIVMLSRPWFGPNTGGVSGVELDNCIRVISGACDAAKAAGDNKVAFISGKYDIFGDDGRACHSDGVHPNNKGHEMMAAAVKDVLVDLLG